MKIRIAYDSLYGNTEILAQVIASAVGTPHTSSLYHIQDGKAEVSSDCDILILGTPTHGGMPSQRMRSFLDALPKKALDGKDVIVFDTRMDERRVGALLRLLMKTIGYAAPKLERMVVKKRGRILSHSQGFYVDGKEGPLQKGEERRASAWIAAILKHTS